MLDWFRKKAQALVDNLESAEASKPAASPRGTEATAPVSAKAVPCAPAPPAAATPSDALSAGEQFKLAMTRIEQRRWADAVALLRQCVAVEAKNADAHYWLGNASMGLGNAGAARHAYQRAVQLNGGFTQARWGLAMSQLPAVAASDGEQASAPGAFRREVAKLRTWFKANPGADGFRAVGAQQPFYLAYIAQNHRTAMMEYGQLATSLMGAWAKKVGVPKPAAAASTGAPGKLRVAIVSAHVHSHSVWHALLRGWVEHLDPARFELQLFHTGNARDTETDWAAKRVARLHHGLGDWTAWAKVLSEGRFDVIVYPEMGMDSTTVRLASLRLARLQLVGWGHPLTTGLPTIDGFISAEAFEPEGASLHYTEKLVALPRLGCCYRQFNLPPTAVNLTTFGIAPGDKVLLCAGMPFKYAPRDDAVLIEIARRCRPCKLVFFKADPQPLAAAFEQRLRSAFEAAGLVFDDAVRFIPWQSHAAFFGLLDRTDVYLDSIGFSGFNTTMQAIERGTPVVAFEGEFMRGRFASAILRRAGLDEWVATTRPAYIDAVERLCVDAGLRARVKQQIAAARHALFDDRATVTAFAEQLIERAAKAP